MSKISQLNTESQQCSFNNIQHKAILKENVTYNQEKNSSIEAEKKKNDRGDGISYYKYVQDLKLKLNTMRGQIGNPTEAETIKMKTI